MSGVIFSLAVIVWIGAVVASVDIVRAHLGVRALAPQGQRLKNALALNRFDYTAVENALGPESLPHVARYRRGIRLYVIFFCVFLVLLVLRIFAGSAA